MEIDQETLNDNLRYLSKSDYIFPVAHKRYLEKLRDSGFKPRVIYDIGSCVLHWTNYAKGLWPDARFILFDAFDKAEFLYKEEGIAEEDYHFCVLGKEDGKSVKFYENELIPGGNSYYREKLTKAFPEDRYRMMTTKRLETIVTDRGFPMPDLIKIDVQGSELDIISGSPRVIQHAKHLIVEIQHTDYNEGAPKVDVTKPYIESLGFECVGPMFSKNTYDADYHFVNERLSIEKRKQ